MIKTKIVNNEIVQTDPQLLADIQIKSDQERLDTGCAEVNRVLGGGIVQGSVILFGGEPGVGKSTLALQIGASVPNCLYISGEEAVDQIKLRANRLRVNSQIYLLNSINVKEIEKSIKKQKPQLVILDSIQTIFHPDIPSSPGSVAQVRESAAYLIRTVKQLKIPLLLIGHITKDGNIAGPKLLEHLVDVVLYFDGDRRQDFRILRAAKNRHGSIDEIGVFCMKAGGLEQVEDFATTFVSNDADNLPGTVVSATVEGSRSFLLEIQALVGDSSYSMPKRVVNGLDANRIAIIVAVIEKRLGFNLAQSDLFINVVGGLKLYEPALDLAVVLAIISSFHGRAFQVAAIGELGLSGEIRPVAQIEKRVNALKKMGVKKIFVPAKNKIKDPSIISVGDLQQFIENLN